MNCQHDVRKNGYCMECGVCLVDPSKQKLDFSTAPLRKTIFEAMRKHDEMYSRATNNKHEFEETHNCESCGKHIEKAAEIHCTGYKCENEDCDGETCQACCPHDDINGTHCESCDRDFMGDMIDRMDYLQDR